MTEALLELKEKTSLRESLERPVDYANKVRALIVQARLDEAEALLNEAQARFPTDRDLAVHYARLAHAQQNWPEAVNRWRAVRARHPTTHEAYLREVQVPNRLRCFQQAGDLAVEGFEQFPESAELVCERGWIAFREHRWADAEAVFAAVREQFPSARDGFLGGARVLRTQGKLKEAERLLEEGMQRMPDEPRIQTDHAHIPLANTANHRRDFKTALQRFEALRQRFPNFEVGYIASITCLRDAALYDDADALTLEAMQRFPDKPGFAAQYARTAEHLADQEEAIRRFAMMKAQFPNNADAYIGLAGALNTAGRGGEADDLLKVAMDRFPWHFFVFSAYAGAAAKRSDWPEALVRWEEVGKRFPHEESVTRHIFEIQLRIAETNPDALPVTEPGASDDGRRNVAATPAVDLNDHDLVLQFESLGGHGHGCEFGTFQRACGAEPLGLLRWADLSPDDLANALEGNLEGIGQPEHTKVYLSDSNEYWTQDKRYRMAMRCFIHLEQIPFEKMERQACRRIQYLREKLLGDLQSGIKIFVYKDLWRDLTDEEVTRLHAAIRRYGDTTLFYVRYANQEHPDGTVELAAPGLLIGYIEHFAFSPTNQQLGPATRSWLALCKKAYLVWKDIGSAAAGVAPGEAVAGGPSSETGAETTRLLADVADKRQHMQDLLLQFESLGGLALGCEFGLLQRQFGVEPLGLMRWTEIGPDQVTAALNARFEGVGLPDNTELLISGSGTHQEYGTKDRRFGMRMHTFASVREIPRDRMFDQVCRRLAFLSRKLMADLEAGEKIFVHKTTERSLTDNEIDQLHQAVRRYGNNVLLCVRYEDPSHPNGTVEIVRPGLMIGYIDRFQISPEGIMGAPNTHSWTTICEKAYALRDRAMSVEVASHAWALA